ncbi:MAG: tetratricopeptide repeat protein [Armatimonadota bacterium]|nr:tetratricopeptide repeat protein [Armatimonadota bacterium]
MRFRLHIPPPILIALLAAAVLHPQAAQRLAAQEPCAQERRDASASGADEYDWIALGRCLLEAGQVDAAMEAFRTAAEIAPASVLVLDYLGIAYVRKGLLQEARELYARVAAHGLQTPIHQGLADAYLAQGDLDRAEVEYTHTIALGYYDAGTLDRFRQVGIAFLQRGELERARRVLQRLFDLRPLDVEALEALQEVYRRLGRPVEAEILHYRHLIALYDERYRIAAAVLREERVRFRLALAGLYMTVGRLAEARQVLEEAVDINVDVIVPLAVEARLQLARVCCLLGDAAAAQQQWERVLQLEPGRPEARQALARLQAVGCPRAVQP